MTCEAANHFYHVILGLTVGLAAGVSLAALLFCRGYAKACRIEHDRVRALIDNIFGGTSKKADAPKAH